MRDQIRNKNIRPTTVSHAGLWLDKFLPDHDRKNKEARSKFVKDLVTIRGDEALYKDFFENRWEPHLRKLCGDAIKSFKVQGRLAIGLGDESVIETSVTLHHTYGVPYLRGSALKGLAASFARNRVKNQWDQKSQAYKIVFGETDDAGYVTFHDAMYVPGSGQSLHADIMTVHHKDYYGNKPDTPPADWDEPNPVPFISATGKYLVALSAPPGCEMWRHAAFEILKQALAEEGIGAKTSSGYGRMTIA